MAILNNVSKVGNEIGANGTNVTNPRHFGRIRNTHHVLQMMKQNRQSDTVND